MLSDIYIRINVVIFAFIKNICRLCSRLCKEVNIVHKEGKNMVINYNMLWKLLMKKHCLKREKNDKIYL